MKLNEHNIFEVKRHMLLLMGAEGCAESSMRSYGNDFDLLIKKVGLFWLRNRFELIEYLNSVQNWNTRNLHRSVILKVCNGLFLQKLQLPYVKKRLQVMPVYTQDQLIKIFSKITNLKHLAIASLLMNEGFRVGEIVSIKIKDCSSKNNSIIIRSTKSHHDVVKYISDESMAAIAAYYRAQLKKPKEYLFENPNGGAYAVRSIQQFMREAAIAAGVYSGESCRILRRSNGTFKLENGYTIKEVADSLGNTVRTVERHYSVIRPERLKQLPVPLTKTA